MTYRVRQYRLVAWLAFAALCLIMLSPTISRVRLSNAPAMQALCEHHAGSGHSAERQPAPMGDPLSGMDKCGYCSLFTHSPLASAGIPALLLHAPQAAPAAFPVRVPRSYARPSLQVRPRGPPTAWFGRSR